MIRARRFQVLLGLFVLAATAAVSGYFVLPRMLSGSLAQLNAPQSLTLYSIDGESTFDKPSDVSDTAELFYNYPVLGKVEIEDAASRKAVVRAVQRSAALARGQSLSKCFWPRHAIHAVESSQSIDVVICFQCHQANVYFDGEFQATVPLTASAKALLNRYLTDAGVPLASEPGQDE